MHTLPPHYKLVDLSYEVFSASCAGLHLGDEKLIIIFEGYEDESDEDREIKLTALVLHELGHAWAHHLGIDHHTNNDDAFSEAFAYLNMLELLSFDDIVSATKKHAKYYDDDIVEPYNRALRHLESFLTIEGIQGPQKITKRHFRRLQAFLEAIGE